MISIIIPTHNKAHRLAICLKILREALLQTQIKAEVIVINDGSTDETDNVIDGFMPSFQVPLKKITQKNAQGRAFARNCGADFSSGRRLLFLDDDILIGAESLKSHYQVEFKGLPILARATILNLPWLRMLKDPTRREKDGPEGLSSRFLPKGNAAAIMESVVKYARRSKFEADIHQLLESCPDINDNGRWPAATGGNLSIERAFFFQMGGFDVNFGLNWGLEDLEFGYRATRYSNGVIKHLADVRVFHMDHLITNRSNEQDISIQYFGKKHGIHVADVLEQYFKGEVDIFSLKSL